MCYGCTRPKPNPDPLLVYMDRCGVSPDEVLYIGDSDYDYHCAKNAKVDLGWLCGVITG